MESRNYLLNKKGQILIESLFLAFVLASILIIFSKLIEYQKSKKIYNFNNFSENTVGSHVR